MKIEKIRTAIRQYSVGGNVPSESKKMTPGDIAVKLLWAKDQANIFHWQTKSQSVHQALDRFTDTFGGTDSMIEGIIGLVGDLDVNGKSIKLVNYSPEALDIYLEDLVRCLTTELEKAVPNKSEYKGIYNFVDNILEAISILKYSLRQK